MISRAPLSYPPPDDDYLYQEDIEREKEARRNYWLELEEPDRVWEDIEYEKTLTLPE